MTCAVPEFECLCIVLVRQNGACERIPQTGPKPRKMTSWLGNLADPGARMAECVADITRAADGHAADAALMRNAWPRVVR
ncbi:MAG: hypothetical protein E2581_08210 [Pseudomonas sp.]|nr:hypothetical protein [Pseudomonas sp.]